MLRVLSILILVMCIRAAFAQQVEVVTDSTKTSGDSILVMKNGKIITVEAYAKRYNPRKALLYAAVFPGLGQIYNKKYWKVPLVYGGFAMITTIAAAYQQLHDKYKAELFDNLRTGAATSPSGYNTQALRDVVDAYRRQRDYFIIIGAFWYLLQMVDAHVDAHLKEFDLNPQLKLSLTPSVQRTLVGQASGVSLTLTF